MNEKQILNNAPKGAEDWTHADEYKAYDESEYTWYKYDKKKGYYVWMWESKEWRLMPDDVIECPADLHSRKDIERIVKLEQDIAIMVKKAADKNLSAYRELGQKCADLENQLDDKNRRIDDLQDKLCRLAISVCDFADCEQDSIIMEKRYWEMLDKALTILGRTDT